MIKIGDVLSNRCGQYGVVLELRGDNLLILCEGVTSQSIGHDFDVIEPTDELYQLHREGCSHSRNDINVPSFHLRSYPL